MLNRKLLVFLLSFALIITIVILLLLFIYDLSQKHKLDSNIVLGFGSALVGGIFVLSSVGVTQELEKIQKDYDKLPQKIRSISQLRDTIWEIRSAVGQEQDVRKKVEVLVDLGSLIDGNIFSKCIGIKDRAIRYHNNMRWEQDKEGISKLIKDNEFLTYKNELCEVLEDVGAYLIKVEEKLLKRYK